MADTTYQGWTNYETWAVKLWMDNEPSSYNHWREAAQVAWEAADDKRPNQFMDRSANARQLLATRLKAEHDDQSDHPVFEAAENTVYADLLNAALDEVDWLEIADALLRDDAETREATNNEPLYVARTIGA